jgi:outer membrane immunogenic protein
MRKQLLLTVAAAAVSAVISGPVAAADLRVKAMPPPPPPAPTWSGLYLGGHVGYGEAEFRGGSLDFSPTSSDDVPLQDLTAKGALVGLHAGYNWQVGMVVVGVEGDVSATPGWNARRCRPADTCAVTDGHVYGQLDALASIRGRLGIAFDRALIYATAGVAWARKRTEVGATYISEHLGSKTGGVYGGGIEWKYNPGLSLRLEGLYYRFDETINGFANRCTVSSCPNDEPVQHGLRNVGVVRIGASWHPQPN